MEFLQVCWSALTYSNAEREDNVAQNLSSHRAGATKSSSLHFIQQTFIEHLLCVRQYPRLPTKSIAALSTTERPGGFEPKL